MKKILAALALAVPAAAFAQAFPAKPIRVIIPNEPGTLDFYIRFMAPKLQELTGQPWIVEYRPGAGGQIGANSVSKAAPDGYTILFTHPGTHVTVTFISKNVLYDPIADFTPITVLGSSWLCLLAHPSLPANTVPELIDYAKKNPQAKLAYSHNGVGNTTHLAGEQLKILTGLDMVHVPYKGGAPALNATVAGEVPLTIVSIAGGAIPQIKSGKVKILAMMGQNRYPGMPNVPTMQEVIKGFESPPGWIGFFGPPQLPRPIADRLRNAVADALAQDPGLKEKVEGTGVAAITNTPDEFAAMLKRDIAFAARIVKAAGIQPE
jgi:tripartite-type tricarboxylate transporter receptor subunit TctC